MEGREVGSQGRVGLVSLGLLMQLVGSIVAAYLISRALEPLISLLFFRSGTFQFGDFYQSYVWYFDKWRMPGRTVMPPAWHLTLVASVGVVRALLHRRAGSAILYGRRGGLGSLIAYLATAFVHTILCLLVFYQDSTGAASQWSVVALLGAVWPVCLLAAVARPGFRRALRAGPVARDATASDEAATLATFLGLVGAMVAVFTVYMAMETFGAYGAKAAGSVVLVLIAALLVVRSVAQLVGGLRGRPVPAGGYVWIGLVGSALATIALAVHLDGTVYREWHTPHWGRSFDRFEYRFHWSVLCTHVLAAYLLFVWPVLLRRFRTARKSAPTSPTGESCRYRARLAALGWLLLMAGGLQLAFVVLTQIDSERGARLVSDWASYSSQTGAALASRSAWLQLLVIVPQVWTAVELLGATCRRRAAATIYAAGSSLATILAIWDDLTHLMRLIGGGMDHPTVLLAYLQVAFALLVPIAALVFIQHGLRREASPQAASAPVTAG